MQLIEHHKLEALTAFDKITILITDQHELEHHVVSEEDIRRVRAQFFTLSFTFLAGIAQHAWDYLSLFRAETVEKVRREKLIDLFFLRVSERIHWVDDNGAHALAWS